jgi:hypothetical protein
MLSATPLSSEEDPAAKARAELKEELEIRKLQTDTLFVKLTFLAQIANTIGLTALGMLVFLNFQRPQLEQMKVKAAADQRQQIEQALENALAIVDPQQRAVRFKLLKESWPDDPVINTIEDVRNQLDAKIASATAAAERCEKLANDLVRIVESRENIAQELASVREQVTFAPGGSRDRINGLEEQLSKIKQQVDAAKRQVAACKA